MLTRISPGFRWVRPGTAGTSSTLISRRPFGPCTVTTAPAGTIAGTLLPAGGAPPLPLFRADQIDRLQHAGPDLAKALVVVQRHARDGRADAKAAIGGLLDGHHLI